ncbi:MAG: M28 family peptidase, partial [Chloroflexi bacterium]|nr:M28 family peptidase [Chloroflexota bacterium]
MNLVKRLARLPALLVAVLFIAAACGSPAASTEPTVQPSPTPTITPAASTSVPATVEPVPSTTQPAVEPSPTASSALTDDTEPTTPTPKPAETIVPTTPTPESTPMPVSEATATPVSTISATTEIPLSEVDILGAQAMAFLEKLTADFSPRQSGTEQELAAAQFLASEFASIGYKTSLQPFTVELKRSSVELESATLEVPSGFRTLPITTSIEESVTGMLTSAGKAFFADVPADSLTGKVALIERGTITFMDKVNRVADAGAVGAIIFNNSAGLFRGTFASQPRIPAVSISREDGLAILDILNLGDISATVTVETGVVESQNVVAEKPGTEGNGDIVILGGHYDTVEGTPGANDNGSGSATVITVAHAIADESYPFDIRFVLFGSEELGLHGSINHLNALTSDQRDHIIAMFNFDA